MSGHVTVYAVVVLFLLQYFSNVSAFNGRCPSGWTFFEHSCYKLYTSPVQSVSGAQAKCETFGASLTSISSAGENQFLHEITEGSTFWIGFNDIQREGVFQWMDGTQFRYRSECALLPRGSVSTSSTYRYCHDLELDYSNWSTHEPNNKNSAEDCVHLLFTGYWNDRNCGHKMKYMCEKEANEEGTLAETTITCPHSFETVFELGGSKTVTWSEPSYLADSLASHIERSHSPGEELRVGVTWVNYTFEDAYDNMATCNFSITLLEVDTTPPTIVLCSSDVTVTKITNLPVTVTSEPPVATDLSESVSLVSQNHFPGDEFEFGVNNVTYTFTDDSGNNALCFFRVNVIEVNNHIGSLFNVDEAHEIQKAYTPAYTDHEGYEAHDSVINEFRGTDDKCHGLITGLYIFVGFVGLILALLLLFVIKLFRTKRDSGVGKLSYAIMNGDAEVDIGI